MGLRFNAEQYATLVDEESKLFNEVREITDKMHTMKDTDKSFTSEQFMQYQTLGVDHATKHRDLDLVRARMSDLNRLKEKENQISSGEISPFNRWVWGGEDKLSSEEKQLYIVEADENQLSMYPEMNGKGFRIPIPALDPDQYRMETRSDIKTGAGAAGEAVVETWSRKVMEQLAFFGNVEKYCTSFNTRNGGDFTINQLDGRTQKGVLLTDQSALIGSNLAKADIPVVGDVTYKAYVMHSGPIRLRREAISDVHFSLQSKGDAYAVRRMARGWNQYFVKGTGTNQPLGIATAAKRTLNVKRTEFGTDDLLTMEYGINRAYRENKEGVGGFSNEVSGKLVWMISDEFEHFLRTMLDGNNRPLWAPSINSGTFTHAGKQPGNINGIDYFVNGEMDDLSAANKIPIVFGHLGYQGIRTVDYIEIFRFFDSRTAQANAVEILGFTRRDSRPMGVVNSGRCEAFGRWDVKGE